MLRWLDRIIATAFILLFSLVPLALTPFNYELFEFNKMLLTYALTAVIVSAWLIKMIVSRRLFFQRTALDLPLLLFLIFNFLSFIFSIDRHTSFFGYYSRFNGGLLSTISYLLLYYAFVSNMTRRSTLTAIRYALYAAALIAAYGIAEHFGIDADYWVQDVRHRVFSTLGQPNWLAAYLVGLIPLTMALALKSKGKRQKAKFYFRACEKTSFAYFLLFTFYFCLLFTQSRSGLLGFGTAYLVFWGLAFLKQRKATLKPFLLFTFAILLLTLLARPAISALAQEEQTLITPSSDIRKIVWQGALQVWQHYPWFGTGPETFAYSYYWYRPREHNDTSEWDFLYNKAHNEYLNYLANTGIFGLGSYLLIITAFIISNFTFRRNPAKQVFLISNQIPNLKSQNQKSDYSLLAIRYALFAGYAGILVSQFFGFSVVITNLFFFLFPAISFVLAAPVKKQSRKIVSLNSQGFALIALVFVFLGCSLLALSRCWYADFLFSQGKKQLALEQPLAATEFLEKAIRLNPGEPLFRNELSVASSQMASVNPELADFAISQSDQALQISHYHLNYWKSRVKMFYYLARLDDRYYQNALETLLTSRTIAPTDAKITYNLAVLYYYLDEKEKAIQTIKETLELKPNYDLARQQLEAWQEED